MDVTQLPPPELDSTSFLERLARLKQQYQDTTGVYPQPTYPETFLLEQIAYEGDLLRQQINYESLQNLLACAVGARLDQYGQFMDTPRLPATHAKTHVTFKCGGHTQPFSIPANTVIRANDNQTVFVLQDMKTVAVGQSSIDAIVMCSTAGTGGNGFLPGEIKQLTQSLAYVQQVENIDTSSGGVNIEHDEAYRARLQLAPAKFSTAGSEDSYLFYTRSAHQDIVDATIESPGPSQIEVTALLKGGQIPDQAMQQRILDTLTDKKVRPIGDRVTLGLPEPMLYSVELTLQFYRNQSVMAAVSEQSAKDKVNTITRHWQEQLGRDIVPEELVAACQTLPGVYRVTTTLTHTPLTKTQFPVCTSVTVTSAVIDEHAR
ncbi:baseplate J/gp47 family protein [Pseudoalteromonas sp. Of7M-16]|uniref:baseplate J/gp47 family protein n=1 Tax=Pseudoalteromonas sp. Of7M-16 TaxID=2917756 RepID=UPI001EF6F330|nr:baseplate J/gp47 family protein [Pseudoalteromonas sp. Of7M-16]MCG7551343.1 baseplate J/gp47 family protein [Pseudoalteromonas sp. Of7M-16]